MTTSTITDRRHEVATAMQAAGGVLLRADAKRIANAYGVSVRTCRGDYYRQRGIDLANTGAVLDADWPHETIAGYLAQEAVLANDAEAMRRREATGIDERAAAWQPPFIDEEQAERAAIGSQHYRCGFDDGKVNAPARFASDDYDQGYAEGVALHTAKEVLPEAGTAKPTQAPWQYAEDDNGNRYFLAKAVNGEPPAAYNLGAAVANAVTAYNRAVALQADGTATEYAMHAVIDRFADLFAAAIDANTLLRQQADNLLDAAMAFDEIYTAARAGANAVA